ncbi:hypothetical protein HDV00_008598 [Rhizophlyctis rosea]|nr:hypothetical protein HDV00_008598 [Rhizophlyctis rosea]
MLFNRFMVKEQLGRGSFGSIYKILDTQTGRYFAVKVEKQEQESASGKQGKPSKSQLEWEVRVYMAMKGHIISRDVKWPNAWYYTSQGPFNYLIMDLLGHNLDRVMQATARKRFSAPTTAFLAQKMITLLEGFHSRGRYVKAGTEHLDFEQCRPLKGTVRFSSINTHLGTEQTRRDDMQSLGYIFVYFLLGQLPWQTLLEGCEKKEGYHMIMLDKLGRRFEDLVKQVPEVIREPLLAYLFYVNSLMYPDQPDYAYCRDLFAKVANRFDGFLI